jgi:apolipoprotein N-acyltransferase
MGEQLQNRDFRLRLLEHFLWGGSSALLLTLAHLSPKIWLLSLLAPVPFIWKAVKTDFLGAVMLGFCLATGYCLVTYTGQLLTAPAVAILNLLLLNLILAGFSLAIRASRKYWGANPAIIAILWIPFGYFLNHFTILGDIFGVADDDSGLAIRIGSLFGSLMISFAIIFLSSLLILTFEIAFSGISNGKIIIRGLLHNWIPFELENHFQNKNHFGAGGRAPPKTNETIQFRPAV